MDEAELRLKREILGVSVLLFLGSLLVLFPFLDAIILGGAASYFLRYGKKSINKVIDNEKISSLIIVSLIIGIIFISLFTFVKSFDGISSGAVDMVQSYQEGTKDLINQLEISDEARQSLNNQVDLLLRPNRVRLLLTGILASLPAILIDVGIFLVVSIFLFKDGDRIRDHFYSTIEKLPENEEKIIRTLVRSVDSIFRGVFVTQFSVAGILGVVAALGFYAIGFLTSSIPFTLLWAILIGIAAIVPLFAAFMVYGPIGLYYLLFGSPVKGLLILTFGTIVLNILPEILIRPYIGSRQMDEHPLIIFLGFLAGPLTLGVKGLILGPVILILSKDFILNYSSLVSPESESHSEDS